MVFFVLFIDLDIGLFFKDRLGVSMFEAVLILEAVEIISEEFEYITILLLLIILPPSKVFVVVEHGDA